MKTLRSTIYMVTIMGAALGLASAAQDEFASATPVGALPAKDTNDGATKETNEPNHGGNAGAASVWWSWKPAADGVYSINTRGSDFDTLLAVYLGDAVGALSLLAGNNNISDTVNTSEVIIRASATATYKIAVDGLDGAVGAITLDIKAVPAASVAANDQFANAIDLGNTATVTRTGTNAFATREFNTATLGKSEPNHNGQSTGGSLWYRWTAPSAGLYTIDTRGSTINTTLAAYQGNAVDSDTIIYLASNNNLSTDAAEIDAEIILSATAGATYRIAVDSALTNNNANSRGNFTLNIKTASGAAAANDNFANATLISGNLPLKLAGNSTTATREPGEPFVTNTLAAASIWWKFTPTQDQEILVDTLGTSFDTLLGVYTGSAVNALTLVAGNNNIDASILQSRLSFFAKANTTYSIVADGIAGTTQRRGDITLQLHVNPERTILARGETWQWLHPTDGTDPNTVNTKFNTTWFTSSYNNTPAFRPAAPGILGYGVINLQPGIISDIGTPEDVTTRFSAYFRKTVTLAKAEENVSAEILADDGAIIYIDGKEVKRVNMSPDEPDVYTLGALATGSEDGTTIVDIGNLAAGQHLIAISLHNTVDGGGLGNSSDLGFDFRLFVAPKVVSAAVALTAEGVGTGFEEADLAVTSYIRGSNGAKEIGFSQSNRRAPVFNLLNAADTVTPRKALRHNNANGGNLTITDPIDVGAFTAIEASILVHTFSASTTNFEATDTVHVYLERSADGQTWAVLGDVIPEVFGLDTNDEDDITMLNKNQELNGDWNRFTSAKLNIPAGSKFLRMVISSNNDSANEYMYFDDILIKPIGGTPAPAKPRITSISRAANNVSLSWTSTAGQSYQVEFSSTLLSGSWTRVGTVAATANASSFTYALPANSGSRGFLRVGAQ